MKRKYKKVRHHTKTTHRRWLFVPLFAFLLIAGLAVKQLLFSPTIIPPLFHGPHLSEALYKSGLNPQDVLGSRTNRYRNSPTPTPTKKPTPTPTPIPTPVPIVIAKQNQYGIAAGGGLSYLGQTDLDTYFSQLKNLGVSWVRYDFDWGVIQKSGSSTFDWSGTDLVAQTAAKYGIKSLGIITYTPTWAQLSACKGTYSCAPADPNTFGVFSGQVASHYAPLGIHYWEIWNEPNYYFSWKPSPNVSSYIDILKSAYANIKRVDPSAFVLSGGLAAAGDESNNIAPTTFIQSLYTLDTTKDFDAIALHPYSYPVVASYPASWNSWQQIGTIRSIMNSYGDGQKPIWLTEYGAPTGGPGVAHSTTQLDFTYGSDYMTEDAQSLMMQDALSQYSQIAKPAGPFFWYSLHDNGTSTSTPENFFGLMRFDWSKKPAYTIFQNAITGSQ